MTNSKSIPEFLKLLDVVWALRHPEKGCPWDLEQTHESLTPYLIEESYELIDAIESGQIHSVKEELGDVLLQVLLHSVISEQSGHFSLEDVCSALKTKLITRHPHVFQPQDSHSSSPLKAQEVEKNWEKSKSKEKADAQSAIDSTYLKFPALMSAFKIGKKTQALHFDWESKEEVIEKAQEEWSEFQEALGKNDQKHAREELGDLFFTLAQVARHMGVDPESCAREANRKFLQRFWKMEDKMREDGLSPQDSNQSQMDLYWDQVKADEKS